MEIRLSDSQQPPFPQPLQAPEPQRSQVQAPMVYVYEEQVWEYKIVVKNIAEEALLSEQELNALGLKRWELAGVATLPDKVEFYFKRVRK